MALPGLWTDGGDAGGAVGIVAGTATLFPSEACLAGFTSRFTAGLSMLAGAAFSGFGNGPEDIGGTVTEVVAGGGLETDRVVQ